MRGHASGHQVAWKVVDEGWGRKAVDFATLSEPANCREYVAVHHRLGVREGDVAAGLASVKRGGPQCWNPRGIQLPCGEGGGERMGQPLLVLVGRPASVAHEQLVDLG
jgi:hypothetical protein